jgi:hypothetical protein
MKMTNVTLPTKAEQMMQQLQQQLQAMQQQPQQGQPNGNGTMPQQPPQAPPQPPQPTQEDVFGLLKDSLLRRFKIDIETDSTVAGDESQEKQDRTQFIESVTKFMEAWGPMVMQKPEMAPLAGNLLMFGVRAFRIGRELEETIEETIDKLSMPQPQKVPDPKVQAEQVKAQAAGVKAQTEIQKSQIDAQTAQQSAQSKQQEIQMKMWATIEELKAKIQMMQQEHAHKQGEAQMEHGANMDKMALQHQQIEGQKQAAANQAKWPTNPGKDQGF